jgi:hypothetical protein
MYINGDDTMMAMNAAIGLTEPTTNLNVYTFFGDTNSLYE